MSEHRATVEWQRGDAVFSDKRYSRVHRWRFDGGAEIAASPSPSVVKPPASDPSAVDPEEAFVAALASCHMLWFLHLAAEAGFVIDGYRDEASGVLGKNADGKIAILKVTLRPSVAFSGSDRPNGGQIGELHHAAHERCFLANSVRTEIVIEPRD